MMQLSEDREPEMVLLFRLSTPCILAVSHLFLLQPNAHNIMCIWLE